MSVFHLKYRPQKLDDLDLSEVGESLKKILKSKDRPQCFLFAGPKGAGKTSAARIVTKAINCLSPNGVEPCGECENCQAIQNGSTLDVVEIDAASNRGIEDVRLLKERAYLLPTKLKNKVFIVDEVHMLTKEAFNALLKLIEEPPINTTFILCTTDPQKIPETVVSRLIRVDFRKGSKKQLKNSLQKVIDQEKIKIEAGAVEAIIAKSDGSFRNLHKTFNEIILEYGREIDGKVVDEYFTKKAGDVSAAEFEEDLALGRAKELLEKMEKMADLGVDFSMFREELLDYFQKRLLGFYGLGEEDEGKLSLAEVTRWLNLLIVAGRSEKEVPIAQLPLQLAVVEFLGNKGMAAGDGSKGAGGKTAKEESGQKDIGKTNEAEKKTADYQGEAGDDFEENGSGGEEMMPMENIEITWEEIEKGWGNLLLTVKPFNHSVEAFLRAGRPKELARNVLVVEVFFPFHKDRLEETRNRRIVEEGIKKVYGVEMGFECVLGENKRQAVVIDNETPIAEVAPSLSETEKGTGETKDIYDVAKDIFG